MIPNGEQSIQISEPTKLSDQHFDTCFILNHNHVSFQTPEYKITLEALDTHSKFLQLFTPASRDCIAIEPMTCAPDALNNRQGLLELSPHHSFDWKVQLDFETF
jgi:aldose 1-epimerase